MTDTNQSAASAPGSAGLLSRVASIVLILAAIGIGWSFWKSAGDDDQPTAPRHTAADGGEHHAPLSLVCNLPGVDQPEFQLADSDALADLTADSRVIGVVIQDVPYAFAIDTLKSPLRHIVNMKIGDRPFSISYCDRADEGRVFSCKAKEIDLRVGGLNKQNELVYLLDGVRYDQSSDAIPLDDHPFEMTTYEEWKAAYPQTKVYFLQQTDAEKQADQKRLQQLMENARIRATGDVPQ